jgi:perosamine synthetase
MGPNVAAFERYVADYSGARHGIAVNSGTSGLHMCLAALNVGPGDEVITSPFSFVASANCILYQSATPVFVDIDETTLNIPTEAIEAAITSRTRAVIPVDVFGQPCDLTGLTALAERTGVAIVEDSCEAIGAEHRGQRVGSHGHPAVFAFYPNKQMTTGEGGLIVCDDDQMATTLRSLANQGRDDAGTWMNHVRLGFNYRMDEMSAALGLSQARRLDEILDGRSRVAHSYSLHLSGVSGVQTPIVLDETTRMSWFVYVIRLDPAIDRNRVMETLTASGVPSRPYFVPIHMQPLYRERFGFGPGDFPVTERVAAGTLAIPFFTEMTEDQIEYVCEALEFAIGSS